jgi:hypothetical protein
MKRILIALLLAFSMAFGALSPANAFLDKTRFLAHIGIAYFVFHHWVMNPYHQGSFAQGAPHRTAAIVKGGVAMLFAVHEVRVAESIAHKSKDPLLQKLDAGVAGLMGTFSSVGQRMKSGQFNPQDVTNLDNQTTTLNSDATAGGAHIKDVPVAVPGG